VLRQRASGKLRRFRQGSILAVAITAWLLMLVGGDGAAAEGAAASAEVAAPTPASPQQVPPADTVSPADTMVAPGATDPLASDTAPVDLGRSAEEAASTIRQLVRAVAGLLPKVLLALALLGAAALLTAVVRPLLRRLLASWTRADATAALAGVAIWVVAISAALSVIVGDPRTLLGSVGLVGLALSWALQQPIESFTAGLLNSVRGYSRVGDRIAVGEVFGDVYRIDFLTTTVWEAGGPDKPVQGAQPTGALVTFPNSEVLRANVVNYTRDFPFVWDELDVGLTNESDLDYAQGVLLRVAIAVVGPQMKRPIELYRGMLERASLDFDIADEPQVFFSQADSWTHATIRYLVDARRRRATSSELLLALSRELAGDEHRGRMAPAYPTQRVSLIPPEQVLGA
jgi:small-conductance mechanosensitive channel